MPYRIPTLAEDRRAYIWPSGVNTDFFCPTPTVEKSQDYFIYYKSQRPDDLQFLLDYLFNNWFGIKGTVVSYYNYDLSMLRDAARASKFCIVLDRTETQGLAALEIMATGCPLFVCDETTYSAQNNQTYPATSVTNMEETCGMKSSLKQLSVDFPIFIQNLEKYTPRTYVKANYSYMAAARRLVNLIAGIDHKS